jgi:hypothetical protein
MRFYQILREYDREREIQRVGEKLLAAAERESVTDVNEIIDGLMAMDPTSSNQYTPWITNQYIKQQFRLEDRPRIKDVLEKFINAKSRLEKKDINQYDFRSLRDLMDQVYNVELETTSSQDQAVFEVPPDSEVLYNGPLGLLAIPKTEEASCELGKGTKWCTAGRKDNRFTAYSMKGPLYTWRDKNGEKYQFHWESTQFKDKKDDSIDKKLLSYFRTEHPVLKKLFAAKEKEIAKDPEWAYKYARDIIRGRWPETEAVIAKDPELAHQYARGVIRGRFPEAEAVIAKDPELAYEYALDVIDDRWPEAEVVIAKDPVSAYLYARNIIHGRWPEAEAVIATDPNWAYKYAKDIIRGRFLEGEAVIAKYPNWAYKYALNVVRGKWP